LLVKLAIKNLIVAYFDVLVLPSFCYAELLLLKIGVNYSLWLHRLLIVT